MRLGWYVAEVRGRNRPGGLVPPAAIAEVPGKPGARRQDIVVTDEIRKRSLTTAADAVVP